MEYKQEIEMLLEHLTTYRKTGNLKHIGPEDLAILKKVYSNIYRVTTNVGCGSCVMHYLTQIEGFYQRNNQPEPTPEATPVADNNIQEPMKTDEANQSTTKATKGSRKRIK